MARKCKEESGPDYWQPLQGTSVERRRFDRLLISLSTRFKNAGPKDLDGEIEEGLKEIVPFFGCDRITLWEFSAGGEEASLTHHFAARGAEPPVQKFLHEEFPYTARQLLQEQIVFVARIDDLPDVAALDRENFRQYGVTSFIVIPIFMAATPRGCLSLTTVWREREWSAEEIVQIGRIGAMLGNALDRKRLDLELKRACAEISTLKNRIELEADYLRSEIKVRREHGPIIGQSEAINQLVEQIGQVAPTGSTVLIHGETGTGKELVAQAVHNISVRHGRLMIKVNCASLPGALVESELFGREKGAYTGALSRQAGRFEIADGSTIFLDEIGELSVELQAKLLRVLQEGSFERLGSTRTVKVDVRVIVATHRNLAEEVSKGTFREDLFYRLNVFPIFVPPLRERMDDIPLLAWNFIHEFSERMGKKINRVAKNDMEALQRYAWPGNIRELRNVIERAVIVSTGETLNIRLPENGKFAPQKIMTLEEVESRHINEILRATSWRIKGEGGAAQLLGMNPSTLYSRMVKLGIPSRPG